METRTHFKLLGQGLLYCSCGSLRDFIQDIEDFILPILEDKIKAEFNDRTIIVYSYDNAESIYDRFKEVLF